MRGDVDTIKERLDIAELISGYIKLEKAGLSFKACCPFHNEKTPSFFISPARQSFYCFGCGVKGDIFTFVEQMEGLDFRGALKLLAERAGVELQYQRTELKTEKDKILNVLEASTKFFEKELVTQKGAQSYLASRGLKGEVLVSWRIGYAPDEWRALSNHLHNLGFDKDVMFKAGLIKRKEGTDSEPYDVFRNRIIFPLMDTNSKVIAFSGRVLDGERDPALSLGTPKYLNSPDTSVFTKGDVLYGLDRAKNEIRKKNYAVLVEGQMDLILSHEAGVSNTVAASGTAFTQAHMERLKRLSPRIILAFDGDTAGEKAAERASELAIFLGLEVKIANLRNGLDPAEIALKNPEEWRNVLRQALSAVEFFFKKLEERETDSRKLGKQIEKKILPLIKLLDSSIEQSLFISMLSKRTGIKEEIFWEDLKKSKKPDVSKRYDDGKTSEVETGEGEFVVVNETPKTYREQVEDRLAEIRLWQKDLPESAREFALLEKEVNELENNLERIIMHDELNRLLVELARAETNKDKPVVERVTERIIKLHGEITALEEKGKIL